jgi:hypothetical protein
MDSPLSHAVVGVRDPKEPPQPERALTARADKPGERRTPPLAPQPPGALALGVEALELVRGRPASQTYRARAARGGPGSARASGANSLPQSKDLALVVIDRDATVAAREQFARVAEDLLAAGEAVTGVLRVYAVAASRDAFVADLWTTGTAADLSALRWSLRRRVDLVREVARSLDTLHGIGIVHGCVCPDNVLLDDDLRPVLCEVGLVSGPALTEALPYASFVAPEVKGGEAPSARSDLFSIGRLLQEIAKGDATSEVTEIVRTCMAPPTSRYASIAEVERALTRVVERLPEGDATAAAD